MNGVMTVGRPLEGFLGMDVYYLLPCRVYALQIRGHGPEIAAVFGDVEVGFGRHLGQSPP
jgi:hypothetical protein